MQKGPVLCLHYYKRSEDVVSLYIHYADENDRDRGDIRHVAKRLNYSDNDDNRILL